MRGLIFELGFGNSESKKLHILHVMTKQKSQGWKRVGKSF